MASILFCSDVMLDLFQIVITRGKNYAISSWTWSTNERISQVTVILKLNAS